jgi:predicted ester cyclase
MNEAKLIDQFIAALQRDPTATPPPSLDPDLAALVRGLVQASQRNVPPPTVEDRVWQRVPVSLRTKPLCQRSQPSTNGHERSTTEDKHMTTISFPLRQAPAQSRRLVAFLAAVLSVILLVGGALFYATPHDTPSGLAVVYISPREANQAVFEQYINEAWNAGNVAILNSILTADHVCHEPGMPPVTGIDGMAAMITNYRTAFPDWTFTVESLTATDDEVWARLIGTGTHEGPFTASGGAVVDATGEAVTVEVMLNARFTDGQIAAQWMQSDGLGLMLQTGALPTPQQAITEAHNLATARLALEGYHFGKDRDVLQQAYPRSFVWQYGSRQDDRKQIIRDSSGGHYPELIYDAFDDLDMTIDTMTATGDMVMAKLTVTGQFVKSFPVSWTTMALTPTGEQETWTWILIWRFEDGQVAEEYWVWDWPLMHGE